MSRHHLSEDRVRLVIGNLVDLYCKLGSVSKVTKVLEELVGDEAKTLHINRIQTLLSGELTRSVNTDTLESIELGLSRLPRNTDKGEEEVIRARILNAESLLAPISGLTDKENLSQVAKKAEVPYEIAASVLGAQKITPSHLSEKNEHDKKPDWSYQDLAVSSCVQALEGALNKRVGLIVPTGGGKTRIALRVGLEALARTDRDDPMVIWVTHRRFLERQARSDLQKLLNEGNKIPKDSAALLEGRIKFVMVSELDEILSEHSGNIELIIVDEGHHMAAPSYREIIETPSLRVLVVTATPIRSDGNDIHIDEIAYTTSYRNLINLGVLVEPSFLNPITLDWKDSETLQNLADYVIDQTESVFQKTLIVVSQKDYAEKLGELILDKLDGTFGHPLDAQDVCWVHGGASSNQSKPVDFLEQFRSKDRAILVATNQLIAEGFDDPKVDSVVVTYPSKSIGHLMQVAGRALRQAPDKKNAYIVQCRESELSYHIEERWLYEDISDSLRPHLEDCKYRNLTDLKRQIAQKLDVMNVEKNVQGRILNEIQHVKHGDSCSLLLTGMPYAGSSDNFSFSSKWGAILSTEKNRGQFTKVFNNFSDLYLMVKDHHRYLEKYIHCDTSRGSEWKSYIDMLSSMNAAHKELSNQGLNANNRNYIKGHGTSWLTYVTFRYFQDVPSDLENFLENSVNRNDVINEYIKNSKSWHLVIKIQLPLGGTLAFLLDETQAEWLNYQRNNLKKHLLSCTPADCFTGIASWRMTLKNVPLHALILERISDLLSDEAYENHLMELK